MQLYSNELIEQLQQLDPNQVLVEKKNQQIRIGQLLTESQILASNLWKQGMREGDRVVIASEMGPDFVKIMFATMMLTCQVAIIDPDMGRENYNAKLDQFDPAWVFLDSRIALLQEHPILRQIYFRVKKSGLYFPRNRKIRKIITGPWMPILQSYVPFKSLLKATDTFLAPMKKTANLPYLVTYTSGTLSEPKGVLHSTANLSVSINLIAEMIRSDRKQIMATHLPHFMLIAGLAGVETKLWDHTWSAQKRIAFIEKEKVSILFAPPAEYLELIDYCKRKGRKLPRSLSHVLLGSAPVHQVFLQKLIQFLPEHTRITCLYGMTENLVVTTIDGRQKAAQNIDGDPLGYAANGLDIKIAEDDEIMIRSNQLYRRYWHKENRGEWHATGDLGYVNDMGILVLKGRKKDMIIRKNFNLYPALYIPTIKKIKGVVDASYVGKYNDAIADEEVHLVLECDAPLTEQSVRKQLMSGIYSIDKEAWPDYIHFRNMPRKGRQQKIDRAVLEDWIKS